jgi:hypothetical protein
METATTNKPPVRIKVIVTLIILLLAFLIYFMIMAMLGPGKKMKSLTEEYRFRQGDKTKVDERIFTDSAYLSLLKEKSFLQSMISMAETDSIYLTINLADSILNLEISGVSVLASKTKKQKICKLLQSGNEYIISSLLSKPMTIVKDYSSIEKEPLMIKMAPKDTSEFQPDIIPDTADYEPVNCIMEMDNGIVVYVYQEEKINPGDNFHRFAFDLNYRLKNVFRDIKSVITFKVPEYHSYIKIKLPRGDVKRIYRALPKHGQVAVYR